MKNNDSLLFFVVVHYMIRTRWHLVHQRALPNVPEFSRGLYRLHCYQFSVCVKSKKKESVTWKCESCGVAIVPPEPVTWRSIELHVTHPGKRENVDPNLALRDDDVVLCDHAPATVSLDACKYQITASQRFPLVY